MPRTLKLVIAYDGSNYAGWQRQANAVSIQQIIEDQIAAIAGAHSPLIVAGRTDSGVHAAAQVASIRLEHPIACEELLRALNARLKGGDIRIRAIEEVPYEFNARSAAKSKTYRYAIWNGAHPSPFFRHVVWHVPQQLDLARMQRAAEALVGEHDFVAFQGRGSEVLTTIRRVISAEITETSSQPDSLLGYESGGRLLRFEITGNGFLRHMVRTIVGTLVDIGRGAREPEEMAAIIASKDRSRTGQTAPAKGLMLWKVQY